MSHFARLAVGAAALAAAAPAAAGIYTDDLSKCLVAKSSAEDRTLAIRWVFGAMSVHPAVADLGRASEAKREELAGRAARLFERLIVEDCRRETVAAVRYDGVGAVQTSFGVLGQVAMSDIMTHSDVNREMEAMASHMDTARVGALLREAGVPPSR
jgi:hypothetical protein